MALLPLQMIDRGDLGEMNDWAQRLGQTLGLDLHCTPLRNAVALQPLQLLSEELYGEHSDSPSCATGLAPLIGFVRKNATQRPLHLYWGGRNAQSDFLYEDELSEYLADGRQTHLGLAFSQDAEGLYVQDRLRQDANSLQTLFAQGAQVLVCGSKDMAAGVRAVLETSLAQRGSRVDDLRLQGR